VRGEEENKREKGKGKKKKKKKKSWVLFATPSPQAAFEMRGKMERCMKGADG
jgi:hypothetical protein